MCRVSKYVVVKNALLYLSKMHVTSKSLVALYHCGCSSQCKTCIPLLLYRKAPLRSQTIWLWWSDQASIQEEGQNDKEDRTENGVHNVQEEEAGAHQEMQAL